MGKSAFDLLDERFGIRTRINQQPVVTQLETTDTLFLRADPNRLAFVVLNLGATNIHVKPNGGVTATNGIALVAGTGSLSLTLEDDFSLPTLEWHGIATTGAVAIFVLEVLSSPFQEAG